MSNLHWCISFPRELSPSGYIGIDIVSMLYRCGHIQLCIKKHGYSLWILILFVCVGYPLKAKDHEHGRQIPVSDSVCTVRSGLRVMQTEWRGWDWGTANNSVFGDGTGWQRIPINRQIGYDTARSRRLKKPACAANTESGDVNYHADVIYRSYIILIFAGYVDLVSAIYEYFIYCRCSFCIHSISFDDVSQRRWHIARSIVQWPHELPSLHIIRCWQTALDECHFIVLIFAHYS